VKFGVFFELSVPRPFTREGERKSVFDSIEQAVLAEELGFDQCWNVEHHFLEEYSHSSAPEMFLTAVAMRTSRIRLGHGIAVCVPEFSHPVRLAERAAMLDILSGGRVEFGTGRSSTWLELGGMGADPDMTKKSWSEFVDSIPKMWTQDRFSFSGASFSMPERNVLPKPVQDPHPPLWVAVTAPGTEIDAAERGLGMLNLSFSAPLPVQQKKIADYRRRIQYCEPAGKFVNEQVNVINWMHVHEDHNVGVERGLMLGDTFSYIAAQVLELKESYPSTTYPRPGLLSGLRADSLTKRKEVAAAPAERKKAPEGLVIGDPDDAIKAIKRWEETGADRIMFLMNASDALTHEQVCESMRLFAREVMPAFAERPDRTSELAAGPTKGAA
jgi:alkanesulfonate monooxygenase SsuD/methylene tetrahydromethanopterin reductase-like flavin-dependent oxidoreductase (luciferase family)